VFAFTFVVFFHSDKNEKNQVRNIEVDQDNVYIGFSKALQVLKKDGKNIIDIQALKFESELFSFCSDNEYLYLGFRGILISKLVHIHYLLFFLNAVLVIPQT
jgi:hypothetical protein